MNNMLLLSGLVTKVSKRVVHRKQWESFAVIYCDKTDKGAHRQGPERLRLTRYRSVSLE